MVEDPEITDKVARKNWNGTKCLALTYLRVGSCIHKYHQGYQMIANYLQWILLQEV
jgi:hypothetical protein